VQLYITLKDRNRGKYYLTMSTHSLLDQAARMLLRVDEVMQATPKEKQQEPGPTPEEMAEA
jgi:hypothetical protein